MTVQSGTSQVTEAPAQLCFQIFMVATVRIAVLFSIYYKMFSVCFFAFFFFWLNLFCELIPKSSGGTFLFLTDV